MISQEIRICQPTQTLEKMQFHLSLNVSQLERSVAFFESLLGVAPAKCRADYAKFEVNNPPLVLSLEPMAPTGRGALNHAGFRFSSSIELVEAQKRLELAGFRTQREEGVECCYSRQTKFWINDPDGNLWEFYTLEEDIEHRGTGQQMTLLTTTSAATDVRPGTISINDLAPIRATCCQSSGENCSTQTNSANDKIQEDSTTGKPSHFEHLLGSSLRPDTDKKYHLMHLRGTFNEAGAKEKIATWLHTAKHHLLPQGELKIHLLTSDKTIDDGQLNLPGPASFVKHVPVLDDLLLQMQLAGFIQISLETFRSQPCFVVNDVQLRETLITARMPAVITTASVIDEESNENFPLEPMLEILYKGPFAQMTDDSGTVFRRGLRTRVPQSIWKAIATSAAGEQFVALMAPQ